MRGRVVTLLCLVVAASSSAASLTPTQQAGKRLYTEGIGASGQAVVANVGLDGTRLPGTAVPCANCHGADGLGRAEAGVAPPVITWSELTKPYDHLHVNGRRHPSFDEAALARAVTAGLDPAGQMLDRVMPRYALGRDDLDNLVAYLKVLEHDADPGVFGDHVRIGSIVPDGGPLAEAGRITQRVLNAYFDEINAAGGIYGRRVQLDTATGGPDAVSLARTARERLTHDDWFAVIGPLLGAAEAETVRSAEDLRVPLIGPQGAGPAVDTQRYTFHLQAGTGLLSQVLVTYGVQSLGLGTAPALVVVPDDSAQLSTREAIESRCALLRCAALHVHRYPAARFDAQSVLQAWRTAGAKAIFFLGSEAALADLLRTSDARGEHPTLLLPGTGGVRTAAQAPTGFDGRLLLAFPSAPADAASPGSAFLAFRQRHQLGNVWLGTQAAAYAAASLFVEGLRRSGRSLSREKLVAALESVRGLRTDVLPALSYGPDRRVGAYGGYVVSYDAARSGFRPVSPWLPLN